MQCTYKVLYMLVCLLLWKDVWNFFVCGLLYCAGLLTNYRIDTNWIFPTFCSLVDSVNFEWLKESICIIEWKICWVYIAINTMRTFKYATGKYNNKYSMYFPNVLSTVPYFNGMIRTLRLGGLNDVPAVI